VLDPNFSEISEALALAGHDDWVLYLLVAHFFFPASETLMMKLRSVLRSPLSQSIACECRLAGSYHSTRSNLYNGRRMHRTAGSQTICHQKSCVEGIR
jgi:hypothetical protein